ncbi:bifunctional diguanylate cyclase/phosphodiesterase [Marinomonas flavescens]|uniref:bifunctional diguanylate cyclase/phosphodiesterase n=1 Tax=Marinomonas flavescens TaxID=2529379 RepID=UPI001054DAB0|nr:bifunctional diguanylate cyclase/phosphodiesterase [Marinomonas flavescens]
MDNVTGYSRLKIGLVSVIISFTCLLVFLFLYSFVEMSTFQLGLSIVALVFISGGITSVFLHKIFMKNMDLITNVIHEMEDIVTVKEYNGDYVFCNKRLAYLYGSTPDEMIGKNDYFFDRHRDQADAFLESLQSVINKFEKETVSESLYDIDTGRKQHLCSTKIPFRDTQNNLKVAIVAKDVTDITQLKEDADRDKRRLEHALDVSEEGLWEWDVHTNQVLHNARWDLITGVESSQETFKEFEACILPEDRVAVVQALDLLLKTSQPYSIEFRIKRPDGKVIWVWDRGRVAEFDSNGDPTWLVGIILDITTEKYNQQKIERLAYYDGLTGLVNRTQLEIELEKTLLLSKQEDCYSAVLFLDLNRFKLLNDSYGHHMGDKLLKMVATRLLDVSKETMITSRFGGDEFVIIYPLIDSDKEVSTIEAQKHADSLIKEVSKTFTIENDHHDVSVDYDISISVGGIVFKSNDVTAGALLQLADLALYRAKSSSSKHALLFDIDMKDDLTHISQLNKDMRQSVLDHDFIIYLQPKVNKEAVLIGAEALVRWQHPVRGLLPPVAFMDQAEESNLIINIGEQVLMQACEQLQKWQQSSSTQMLTMSVNLSAKQIWQSQFVEDFMATVCAYDIDKSKLIVEVTETVLLQDINDATDKMNRLKSHGIAISLDDFGTGYSSLSYLHRLPIDELKIDRSFIKDLAGGEQIRLMVKSIVDLADNFGVSVVAEGVETNEQFELLKQHDVYGYQGYYFSKPISLAEFDLRYQG